MSDRVEQEVALLKRAYPEMEWRADAHWARIPQYPLPSSVWKQTVVQLAFQIPESLPGQAPYGFWVHPGLELPDEGSIENYSYPVTTPFGDNWGQFSWQPHQWRPGPTPEAGTNMVHFVRSFVARLSEGS